MLLLKVQKSMKSLFVIPFLCISLHAVAALSLVVEPLTGNDKAAALSTIGYVKLNETSLRVFAHDGALLSESSLQDVRRVVYREGGDVMTATGDRQEIVCRVFPNPTEDFLIVENSPCGKVYVFGIDGRQLCSAIAENGYAEVDVSELPAGTYILLINTETVKFIKK